MVFPLVKSLDEPLRKQRNLQIILQRTITRK